MPGLVANSDERRGLASPRASRALHTDAEWRIWSQEFIEFPIGEICPGGDQVDQLASVLRRPATRRRKDENMADIISPPLPDVEQALSALDITEIDPERHLRLRRAFTQIGSKLVELGDVIVFVNGTVGAFDPYTPAAKIVEFAGKDPEKYCVFRLDSCGGPPAPLKEGEKLEMAEELIVSLCTPPADGADRMSALARDVATLGRAGRRARVSRLREGQDALLADFLAQPGDVTICGVVVSPQYPATGPDWFLLDAHHELPGFGGGRRGPFHEGDLPLVEYSIHPSAEGVPSAAEHVISVVARRLLLIRRIAVA